MVFFEDLFDIGYNGNRYGHNPKDSIELPMRSDIVNIIWCHQNLEFKNGIKAKVSTAVMESMKNNAVITGSEGTIQLPDPWMPGREGGPYHAKIIINKIIWVKSNTSYSDIKIVEMMIINENKDMSKNLI